MCREDFNQIQFAVESESYNLIFDLPPDKDDDDDGYDHVVYQDGGPIVVPKSVLQLLSSALDFMSRNLEQIEDAHRDHKKRVMKT